MRYLILLLFVACNSEQKKEIQIPIASNLFSDSLLTTLDSLRVSIGDFSEVADYAKEAKSRIVKLEKERDSLKLKKEEPRMFASLYREKDESGLMKLLEEKDREIASLKNKLRADSLYHARVDRVQDRPIEIKPEKPNDNSLVITLTGVVEQGASVWIMESNRKAKKIMKGYYNCQVKDLNSLGAKEAKRYKDVYFFNDIPTGKYLIKVCALYGDWVEIKRKDEHQTVAMKVAPPIQ